MDGDPNALAYLALFMFIPFGTVLFFGFRPALAATMVFLLAFMFLPELTWLKLPGIPQVGKEGCAALACAFGLFLRSRRAVLRAKPFRGIDVLWLLLFVGDIGTAMTNKDIIQHGDKVTLQALDLHEGVSVILSDILNLYLPFLVGRAVITQAKDVKTMLNAVVVAGICYTPFLFIELMMSPQLNMWIYGFHQHDFIQTIRGSGYRPMVFMPHGLAVGLFMAWAVMGAILLKKVRKAVFGVPSMFVSVYNLVFLVWIKSVGALVYALVSAPVLYFFKPKNIVRIATVLAVLVFTYPLTRASNVFPEDSLVSLATSLVGGERAQSLEFRFANEHLLADHARERQVFGWGRFQRSMVFDDYTGRAISVSDGYWIVLFSIRGYWGFAFLFLPILWPIITARKRLKKITEPDDRMLVAGFAWMLVVGSVDLLPNAMWNCIMYFFAGALWSVSKALAAGQGTSAPSSGGGGGEVAGAPTGPTQPAVVTVSAHAGPAMQPTPSASPASSSSSSQGAGPTGTVVGASPFRPPPAQPLPAPPQPLPAPPQPSTSTSNQGPTRTVIGVMPIQPGPDDWRKR